MKTLGALGSTETGQLGENLEWLAPDADTSCDAAFSDHTADREKLFCFEGSRRRSNKFNLVFCFFATTGPFAHGHQRNDNAQDAGLLLGFVAAGCLVFKRR